MVIIDGTTEPFIELSGGIVTCDGHVNVEMSRLSYCWSSRLFSPLFFRILLLRIRHPSRWMVKAYGTRGHFDDYDRRTSAAPGVSLGNHNLLGVPEFSRLP